MKTVREASLQGGGSDGAVTPLWLTIVANMVGQWTSYDGVKVPIIPSVHGLIADLFQRLEAVHGEHLVRAVLAFLTLCRRSGISETELAHLLSLDDEVLKDVYEWWVPPSRTCPPLVLTMLLAELAPYLSRRGDRSGLELVSWFHRQFSEVAEEHLFRGVQSGAEGPMPAGFKSRDERHQQLADFFSGRWAGKAKPYSADLSERVQQPSCFPGETAGERMVPAQPLVLEGSLISAESGTLLNTRRIHERVHHAIRARDEEGAVTDLCSVTYVAAKVAAGAEDDLLREYSEAMTNFPAAAGALGEFSSFVGRHRDVLQKLPMAPFQLAAQEPDTSRVYLSLKHGGAAGRTDTCLWVPGEADAVRRQLVLWPGKPQQAAPCQLTIREHESEVNCVAYSPCGRWVASGSDDTTVKICSSRTGKVECTLSGHSRSVTSIAFSPNALAKRIVSGSPDGVVKMWDTKLGAEVRNPEKVLSETRARDFRDTSFLQSQLLHQEDCDVGNRSLRP